MVAKSVETLKARMPIAWCVVVIGATLFHGQPCDAQTILNGDFENNTSVSCDWNLPNAEYTAKMANSTAFLGASAGVGEIDIMEGDCGYSSPPQSGTTKIAISVDAADPVHVDAFSLDLSSPFVPGYQYELCFYAEANTDNPPWVTVSNIQVGESTSATSFGKLLFTIRPTDGGWTQFCQTFTASTNGGYVTVKNTEGQVGWNHLDNFTLELGGGAVGALNYSPDTTVSFNMEVIDDKDVAWDDLGGTVAVENLGVLPDGVDLDAYHRLSNGNLLLSFDTVAELPGGILAAPGDVARFDGNTYVIQFDASTTDLAANANVDAVSVEGGDLLLSFDISVSIGTLAVDDEDLVRFRDQDFSPVFDGSTAGVSSELDLDAAHMLCNGHLLLSFDGSGVIEGLVFDDEDLLEYDPGPGTWARAYDGSSQQPDWGRADLDAVHATAEEAFPDGEVLNLRVDKGPAATSISWESQDGLAGTATSYNLVSGLVSDLRADAGYYQAICLVDGHADTPFADTRAGPSPGNAYYYLVRAQNGCGTGTYGDSTLTPDPRDGLDAAGPCP